MPATTWSDVTALLDEARGRYQKIFEPRTALKTFLKARMLDLEFYNGQYRYRFPLGLGNAFTAAFGTPGKDGNPTSDTAYFYPKKLYGYIELDGMTAAISESADSLQPGVMDMMVDKVNNCEASLARAAELALWGDGSGRLAKIVKVTDYTTYARLWLHPTFSMRNTVQTISDCTKYFSIGMYVDVATYSEAAQAGALVADATGYQVVGINPGTALYVNGTEDSPYIDVSPTTAVGVAPGTWVVLHNSLDAMPVGIMGMLGGGYSDALLKCDDANYPRRGLKIYGTIDTSDPARNQWAGNIYDLMAGDATAKTLTEKMMDDWFIQIHRRADTGDKRIKVQAILGNPLTTGVYCRRYTSIRSTLFNQPVPQPNLGFATPTYTSLHGDGEVPIIGFEDMPVGMLIAADFGPIKIGAVKNGTGWTSGQGNKGWSDMLPIKGVKEDTMVKAYRQYGMYVCRDRRCLGTMFNINIAP
jgi:hypothetical protein